VPALAHALADQDIPLIPIVDDGSRRPACRWRAFQDEPPTHDQIDRMFKRRRGAALVGGRGVETLDFDASELVEPWRERVEAQCPGLLDRLPMARTPSGGQHVYYRHTGPEYGNRKLAMALRDGKRETLIETRGKGGYAIVPPTPAECHPTGRPYVMLQGSLLELPTLTGDERELLLSTARQFNEIRQETRSHEPEPGRPGIPRGDRPGDCFNAQASWDNLLRPHGWQRDHTRDGTTYWTRPGKDRGVSASTNYGGKDLLYVFSTNADPFDSERSYVKFATYTLLHHGGDFKAAYRSLALHGYGTLGVVQVARLVIPLSKKKKRYFVGTCPFCGSKDMFGVFPAEGFWRCFSCDVEGDAATLRALLRLKGVR
jgi:hypothetical protein